jgi:hypothetical protein
MFLSEALYHAAENSGIYRHKVEILRPKTERYILSVMKMADSVTKLQNVLRPKGEEPETISFRKGKRIIVPAKDVERLYQQQRKRIVQVMYTGPGKLTCRQCGTPFLSLADGRGRYPEYHSNACKQKAYRDRQKDKIRNNH